MNQTPDSFDTHETKDFESNVDRRDFLDWSTTAVMGAGLVASYGCFAIWAGRFLYPRKRDAEWIFVTPAGEIPPGGSFAFESPSGLQVVITRKGDSPPNEEPTSEQFLALSSVCPHLGCRVHWEPHNDRYFCPCHNGTFDPQGNPTGGPVLAANQHLPKYELQVQNGLLYIDLPSAMVGVRQTVV